MKIILLGAGGYHPNSHRHTTCVMLPEQGLVIDAGTGAFRIAERLATSEIDLFLTHAHADHIIGLTHLLGLFPEKESNRLRVHGVLEKLAAIDTHLYSEHLFPVKPNFTPVALDPTGGRKSLPGGGEVCWFPLEHPGGALGYRFEGVDPAAPEKSFALVTDTTATIDADYRQHLTGVDLLIHEAYFDDSRRAFAAETGHSCVSDVTQLAADVRAKRLVLTHMNPRIDEREPFDLTQAKQVFPNTVFGQDLMEIEL